MSFSYFLRLLCLSSATFFLIYALFAILVSAVSGSAFRLAQKLTPRPAARLLFALRVLPLVIASVTVLALCVPSYLWLEPHTTVERIGIPCGVLSVFGLAFGCLSLLRFLRALATSFHRHCSHRSAGREVCLRGETLPVVIVNDQAPVLVLAGVIHSRLLISRGVLLSLSAEEFDAALRHEEAHRASRDNLKRLVFLLAPGVFPFSRGFLELEQHWAKFTEWAADDQATMGNPCSALALASALVRVARMGAAPPLAFLHTSLVAEDRDFSARVERLLSAQSAPLVVGLNRSGSLRPIWASVAVFAAASLSVLLAGPAALSSVHRLLELFLR